MKLFWGLIAILLAVAIAGVAGDFSVTGLAAIFAASFWPVIAMGGVLESGKIAAVGWLHANWRNPRVSLLHKLYLIGAIIALMLITAIGIYGFLAKGHLDQQIPVSVVNLRITNEQQRLDTDRANIQRLNDRQAQLDAAVNSLIQQNYVLRSQSLRSQQRTERTQIAAALTDYQHDIDQINEVLLPLKVQTTTVAAQLGPVKYIADLFAWNNPDAAVRLVIMILMTAFDPLAIALIIAGSITFGEWLEQRPLPCDDTPIAPVLEEYPDQPIPPIIIQRPNPEPDDKQTLLAILHRNPSIIDSVIDTIVEWHEQHR